MSDDRTIDTGGEASEGSLRDSDIRPIVASGGRSFAVAIFVSVLGLLAFLLFTTLDSRRRALSAPATRPSVQALAEPGSSVPALYVPPEPLVDREGTPNDLEGEGAAISEPLPVSIPSQTGSEQSVPEPYVPVYSPDTAPPAVERPSAPGRVVVFDRAAGSSGTGGATAQPAEAAAQSQNRSATQDSRRVQAGRLANPSTTVVQGTVVPAVLETAIDTNRAGPARAIVSQDVRGFDGERILIPRGSRLIGNYGTGLVAGQNRVLVEWTRLIRPDGATIALNSPSSDRLGRAGIRGDVNSHFWERFASAIFRTSLDVGAVVAGRAISNDAVIFLPQTLQQTGSGSQRSPEVQRTLTVDQGAAISVFVAQDLDFTPVERG